MTEILYVTLARGGSRGVPGKHTRILGGKPVIEWTIHEVQKCTHKGDYAVSSDEPEILYLAKRNGVIAIKRPKNLALDNTPTLPALQHAISVMEEAKGKHYDYVIEVRATSPFKTSEDIDACVDLLIETGVESVIGVTPLEDNHPCRAKWLDEDGYLRDFVAEPVSGRRQDCIPKAYIRNGTVYALRTPITALFGHAKSIGYVMPEERGVNIDTEMDWKMCKLMIAERNEYELGS
jgi:CMP-N,N'-diacetyllegionaminic acid synthase